MLPFPSNDVIMVVQNLVCEHGWDWLLFIALIDYNI